MRKYLILVLLMSLQLLARGQSIAVLDSLGLPYPTTAKGMRYWLDDDEGSVTTVSDMNGRYSIDAASLLNGLHTVHYQIIDSEDKVGPAYSSIFLKLESAATASQAATLRYWYDDATTVMTCDANVGVQQLDASALLGGLHILHYQVLDAEGNASYIASNFFLKIEGAAQSSQAGTLRYWFDDATTVMTCDANVGVQQLDASALLDGLHILNYQVLDAEGNASYIASNIFLKIEGAAQSSQAATLRYWFDDATTVMTCDANVVVQQLDASALLDGLHTLHYQVVSEDGNASYIASNIFLKIEGAAQSNQAGTLRYWFDDAATVMTCDVNVGVQQLDASALLDGLHTLHYQVLDAEGNASYIVSNIFLKMKDTDPSDNVTVSKLIYWFDDQQETSTVEATDAVQVLDASTLLDGLHTVHYIVVCSDGSITSAYSSIFLRMNIDIEATVARRIRYWFDDETSLTEVEVATGAQTLDASHLLDGLHTVHYQLIDQKEVSATPMSSFFFKMTESEASTAQSLRYWFDDNTEVMTTSVAGGNQTLDVSGLLAGLHTLHYQLVDSKGNVCEPVSGIFLKQFDKVVESEENVITQYMYWLNDNSADNQKVKIDSPSSPYQLITLLPMIKAPIRSSNFLFDVKDSVPMIYAKNELHIRFEDAKGYWVDDSRSFIDYNVSEIIDNASELKTTQTFARPEENGIKWFEFEAAPGDTIAFKASQATTMQVFAPSGKEILSAMGDKSVQYTGAHTWETGTYYVAVHDVTGNKPNITLDYMHMDKYDVVDQDVRVVGNGGCSTITFQGNGFRDLYAVDLYTAKGDTIHSIDVGHESDATTTVTFDFTGAKLGKYNAVFHFTEEDKTFANNITVEEAKDIELATKVSYPSTFLRGTSVTYTVEITNKGNMNAYCVPIFTHVTSPRKNSITRIKYEGLDLPNVFDAIEYDSLSTEEITAIENFKKSMDDDLYFIKSTVPSENNPYDSVFVRSNYFMDDFAPYETKTYLLHINTSDVVQVYVTVPDGWNEVATYSNAQSRAKGIRKASLKDEYCCIAGQLECILSTTGYFLDMASALSIPISAAFGPEVAAAIGIADCSVGIADATNRATQAIACDPENAKKSLKDKLKSVAKASASTAATAALSCVSAKLGTVKNYLKQDIQDLRTVWSNLLSSVVAIADNAGGGTSISCESMTKPKPGCPPNPPKGGGSSPVNSYDPNEIYGYIAPSGSMYVGDEVLNMPYRIEFENDTTFATSAAHKVVVKDTLDAKVFDLSSYQPTSIKIGDKSVQLKGDKTFVTTVDMRPEINAIAQVEGTYDEKKGIATWTFTSLDPMTMEPTDDIMQGFLPVNYEGSGIGEVAYNINRKAGLPDGTEINNRASIVFDANDPILTPTWTNIVDAVPPVSHVREAELVNDTIVRIHFDGEDNRSGIWKYAFYVQYGENTAWNQVAETDTTCFDFRYYEDIDYGFCVVATDSAGNVEKKIIEREYKFLNGEGVFIDGISSPRANQVANRAYDLSGHLIQDEGYRGVIIKNRKKLLKR